MFPKSTVERKKDISKRSTIPKVTKGNPKIRALTGQTRKNIELPKLHKGPVPGTKGIWPQLEVLNFWVLKQEGSRKNLPKEDHMEKKTSSRGKRSSRNMEKNNSCWRFAHGKDHQLLKLQSAVGRPAAAALVREGIQLSPTKLGM